MSSDPGKNIAKALELKEQGNEAFKQGDYRKAMGAYHEIFMYVHGFSEGAASSNVMPGGTTVPVSAEQMTQIRELKIAHHSNLAICLLKVGNVEKARDNCTKALAIDPSNIKCLFRRGKCYSHLGALDEAKTDLDQVLAQQPDNRDALREMQTLRSRFASHKKKEQKRFAGFFEKLNKEEEAEPATIEDAAVPPPVPAIASAAAQVSCAATSDQDEDSDIGEALSEPQPFEPTDVSIAK